MRSSSTLSSSFMREAKEKSLCKKKRNSNKGKGRYFSHILLYLVLMKIEPENIAPTIPFFRSLHKKNLDMIDDCKKLFFLRYCDLSYTTSPPLSYNFQSSFWLSSKCCNLDDYMKGIYGFQRILNFAIWSLLALWKKR